MRKTITIVLMALAVLAVWAWLAPDRDTAPHPDTADVGRAQGTVVPASQFAPLDDTSAGQALERAEANDAEDRDVFRDAFLAFLAWSAAQEPEGGVELIWTESSIPLYRKAQDDLLQLDPRLQDYPFLDPEQDRPSNTRFLPAFNQVVFSDHQALRRGFFWEDRFDGKAGSAASLAVADHRLEDPESVAWLPPSQLASMPRYGEVSRERIVEQLPLLQSLRLEYLDAVYPSLLEALQLRTWANLARHSKTSLPDELRLVDLDQYVTSRLDELQAEMEPYRARYLRAVGEAIGATELPPID